MSRKFHVVGLCGFAFVGKDTVADLLACHGGFRKLAFADALRAELCEGFAADPSLFTTRELKETPAPELAFVRCLDNGYVGAALKYLGQREAAAGITAQMSKPRTPRETLQLWGTQYRRAQDPNYWTRQVRDTVGYFTREAHETRFVVTDVRYQNEADLVRTFGGELWQIRRPGSDGAAEGSHTSATDGTAFRPDRIISNSHSLKHLQQLVLSEFFSREANLPGLRVELPA